MAEKYTYTDIIIDPDDARVEIGKEYWFADYPFNVLLFANRDDGACHGILSGITRRDITPFFIRDKHYACLIRKKEEEQRYVPFDLTKEEDRARLRGAWVRDKGSGREYAVTGIFLDETPPYVEFNDNGFEPDYLLENYEFVDGSPCGRFAEEE